MVYNFSPKTTVHKVHKKITPMFRPILLLACMLFLFQNTNAQAYRTAAGLRFASGKTIGLSVQQKVMDKITVEGIFQNSSANVGLTSVSLLAEMHQKILFKRLNLYYGAGIHKGWYKNSDEQELSNPSGLATIAGLELALGRMVFSWDIQPNVNVLGGDQFLDTSTGFSLRYIFVKQKKKKKNWKFWKKKK